MAQKTKNEREGCECLLPRHVPKWPHPVRRRPERRVLAGLGPRPTKPSNPCQTPSTRIPRRTLLQNAVPICVLHPDLVYVQCACVWTRRCASFSGDQLKLLYL